MKGHCDFQPAAEGSAVNRGDHWFRTIFNRNQQVKKVDALAFLPRRDFAEFLDVGSGDKCTSAAN